MLDGVRVVDLTAHLSGPYCTWVLASLGADVIKVERPGSGDPARAMGPHVDGESTYFGSINRNKRSLSLDLKQADGRAVLARLVETSDVLVENFRPGVLSRLGFPDDRLAGLNPRLVRASISGFGQTGPLSDRPAYDIVVQAFSGTMSITGPEGGPPVRVGLSLGDIGAALFATIAILGALFGRGTEGPGRALDVAMADCQLALLENAVARSLNTGDEVQALGTRHPVVAPFQAFETEDAMLVVTAGSDGQWLSLCRALQAEGLAADPRYATAPARIANHAALAADLGAIFRTAPRQTWLDRLVAAEVPCGPLQTVSEALASEHVATRKLVREARGAAGPPLRYVACPVGEPAGTADRAAPAPGQHTDEGLRELGYSPERITDWRAQGVV